MDNANKTTKWVKGQNSPNPAGRPRSGHAFAAQLRGRIENDIESILTTVIDNAKAGDVGACKILLERVLPALKPIETVAPITMPANASVSQQGVAIINAVADGALAPSQAVTLIGALETLARLIKADELKATFAELERNSRR